LYLSLFILTTKKLTVVGADSFAIHERGKLDLAAQPAFCQATPVFGHVSARIPRIHGR
jgi:hypothetical protein